MSKRMQSRMLDLVEDVREAAREARTLRGPEERRRAQRRASWKLNKLGRLLAVAAR